MNTLRNSKREAIYSNGQIVVSTDDGLEIRFPVAHNPRLKDGSPKQLSNIELSPFGIHWPDLDEDLSFEGLAKGDFGQFSRT